YETGGPVWSSTVANGTVYEGSEDGYVFAIRAGRP
ncbi:MAG: PQQ-binding-like beta-propeller repeat protein, partial [Chloroflexi bacterium]|nr:PQQ-binding-like beta-propeller repeat protein [Chloroflexota bacterium]